MLLKVEKIRKELKIWLETYEEAVAPMHKMLEAHKELQKIVDAYGKQIEGMSKIAHPHKKEIDE